MIEQRDVDRIFFAILPPREVAAAIARRLVLTKQERILTGRSISADRLHVSLYHIGDFVTGIPANLVPALHRLVGNVRFKSFPVTFDQAMSFKAIEMRPFVLTGGVGLDELRSFHAALGGALQRDGEPFNPHLTLLRDRKSIPRHPIQPVKWVVEEFVLVHSLVGQGRYQILGRWKLD
jgi:2'-5' RNA ligase